MSFLGQLDFAELQGLLETPRLPQRGRLLLFYDTWEMVTGDVATDRRYWSLVYVRDGGQAVPVPVPSDDLAEYPQIGLTAALETSFRNPADHAWDSREFVFEHWDELWDFQKLVTGHDLGDDARRHEVGGHPDWIQHDARIIAEAQRRGLSVPYPSELSAELEQASREWTLLWQLSALEERGFLNGAYGTFYLLIHNSDLEREDFSHCHLSRQNA